MHAQCSTIISASEKISNVSTEILYADNIPVANYYGELKIDSDLESCFTAYYCIVQTVFYWYCKCHECHIPVTNVTAIRSTSISYAAKPLVIIAQSRQAPNFNPGLPAFASHPNNPWRSLPEALPSSVETSFFRRLML